MNFFNLKTASERYSKGRPDFHSNTIKHIKDYLHLDKKLNNALDIACGTGLSTKALLEIATNVYGTDTSQEIVEFCIAVRQNSLFNCFGRATTVYRQ